MWKNRACGARTVCACGLCVRGAWTEGRRSAGRLRGRVPAARCPRRPSRPPTDPHSRFPLSRPPPPARPGLQGEGSAAFARPVPPSSPASHSPSLPPSPGLPFLSSFSAASTAVPLPRHVPQPGSLRRAAPVAPPAAGGAGPRGRRGVPLLGHRAAMGGSWGDRGEQRGSGNATMEAPPPPPPPGAPSASEPAGCPKDADRQLRLRLCVLNEILSTERDYVGTLHFLQSVSGGAGGGSPLGGTAGAGRAARPLRGRPGGCERVPAAESNLWEVPREGPLRAGRFSCARETEGGGCPPSAGGRGSAGAAALWQGAIRGCVFFSERRVPFVVVVAAKLLYSLLKALSSLPVICK